MTGWTPDLVIYHGRCNDGFTSAWIARKFWHDAIIEFVPASYGDAPIDMDGRRVLIVDFSYKHGEMLDYAERADSVVILDHHKTAEKELAPFNVGARLTLYDVMANVEIAKKTGRPPILAHFDMKRSGAMMTWNFCRPGKVAPALVQYVQDHDLWTHELADSQAFAAAVSSYDQNFAMWDMLCDKGLSLSGEGRHILRANLKMLDDLIPLAALIEIGGFVVPCLNLPPQQASLGGHLLLTAHREAPFAATYWASEGRDMFSLRSMDNRQDVSVIARGYGGGGHRNAAGFSVPSRGHFDLGIVQGYREPEKDAA